MRSIIHQGREFFQIEQAKNYYVSRCGAVYSNIKQRCLNLADNGLGYLQVWLKLDDGTEKWQKVHRLVATRFLPNPDNLPDVNHLNKVRSDNRVDNLEWSSRKANVQHSFDNGRKVKKGTEHHQFGKKASAETKAKQATAKLGEKHPKYSGDYLTPAGTFPSAQAAATALGTYPKKVDRWCKGGRHQAQGFNFIPLAKSQALAA